MYNELESFVRNWYDSKEFIPLHAPVFFGNEKKYLNECIDSTFVSYVGQYVNQFEDSIAQYTGSKRAIATVNGTAALHIALVALGVKEGDEVITQPLTFVATANAISYVKASPVFVDVDEQTLGLSYQALKGFLESNVSVQNGVAINKLTQNRITACIPMHTFGFPCEIEEIVELCHQYGIAVIEDAAESLGSFKSGKHTGTFGEIGILSFNGNKTITSGGGGMVITNDEKLADKIKYLTTTAKAPHPYEFFHDEVGYNYRMTNLNAAVGLAQMECLDEILANKRSLAKAYQSFFEDIEDLQFRTEPKGTNANYWLNTIQLSSFEKREEFLKSMNERGVMCRPVWTLMNKLPMYKNAQTTNLPISEKLSNSLVNLPSSIQSRRS